jgi:L-alanine-DL-glutamate epimerase-like enolase superfamily enzyme
MKCRVLIVWIVFCFFPAALLIASPPVKFIVEGIKGAPPCAIAAIDMALYDMNGKILGKPIYEMLGLARQDVSPSCKTISLAQLSDWKKYLQEFREQRFIKVKVNSETDLDILKEIHQETGAKLFVDANEAWSPEAALLKCKEMDEWGFIEFIEQPIGANQRASLEKIKAHCKIPIILDEDITTLGSMHRMRSGMDGINIKVQKVGGIYRAIEMITEARRMSKKILLGCRIESSVGITAASHLMPLVDYVDLDSAAMIVNDPYRGAYFNKDTLIIPNSHGLGIISASRIH